MEEVGVSRSLAGELKPNLGLGGRCPRIAVEFVRGRLFSLSREQAQRPLTGEKPRVEFPLERFRAEPPKGRVMYTRSAQATRISEHLRRYEVGVRFTGIVPAAQRLQLNYRGGNP
jgi:hypothetical protein